MLIYNLPRNKASVVEKRISKILRKLKIVYFSEVGLEGLVTEKGNYYRFDFYLPHINTFVEYDGKTHELKEAKGIDNLKDKYATKYKYKVFRLNKRHYHNLENHIRKLLGLNSKQGINKRINPKFKLTKGKYSNYTLEEVQEIDYSYYLWLIKQKWFKCK